MMVQRRAKPKLTPTFMDSAVAAVVPVFIIGMIVSLLYFLVVAFYRGDFDARLMYLLSLFSAATVLIALIAIESGRAHANLFSLPLGIASFIAMLQFVEARGPMAELSWMINLVLLGIAWWLADRITFDCCVVDPHEKSLQVGLLQSLGLVSRSGVLTTAPKTRQPIVDPKVTPKSKPAKEKRHNPGVWVLYFSLLALPLFGLGQLVIPTERRGSGAFTALMAYLGCALFLLCATSFLSLRRYARQKGVEMPPELSRSWLLNSGLGIALLLLACLILPLPGRSLGLVGLPFEFGSPVKMDTSRAGWGNEGEDDGEQEGGNRANDPNGPQTGPADKDTEGNPVASDNKDSTSAANSADGKKGSNQSESSASQSESNQGNQAKDSQPNGKSAESDANQSATDRESQPPSKQKDSSQSNAKQREQQQRNQQQKGQQQSQGHDKEAADGSNRGQNSEANNGGEAGAEREGEAGANDTDSEGKADAGNQDGSNQSDINAGSTPSNPLDYLPSMASGLGELIKWATIAVLAGIVIFYAVTHPQEIREAIRGLLDMLAALFGRKRNDIPKPQATLKTLPPAEPAKPFRDYPNPFAPGQRGWSPDEVVSHTFRAMQAWGNEHGVRYVEDRTAGEYAQALAHQFPELQEHGKVAANMVDRLLFAGWKPTLKDASRLQALWKVMTSR